jgi:hypothetical protein
MVATAFRTTSDLDSDAEYRAVLEGTFGLIDPIRENEAIPEISSKSHES